MGIANNLIGTDEIRNELMQVVDRAHVELDETVDRAAKEIGEQGTALIGQASNVIHGLLTGVQAVLDKAVTDLNATIAGLDGWTATITIQPITIRLDKPQK